MLELTERFDDLPILAELGDQLDAAFERSQRPRRATRSAGPFAALRGRRGLLVAVAVLVLSAVALAASGVLTGEPVKNPPGFPKPKPHVALGVIRPNSVTLTALRVPDPAGGPPWGLRTMSTTRAFGCVQVGRVVDGRLGVLGQDGAFGNDGRFHELPAVVDIGRECRLVDGAGRPFIAISYQGMPASGPFSRCVVRRPPAEAIARLPKAVARRQEQTPLCPRADLRILYYGTLGPLAQSVTYKDHGQRRTVGVSGPWGAYLVVKRPDRKHPAAGYFVPGTSPASGLVSIRYRDGHVCRIRNPRVLGGAKACPRVGYVAAPSRVPGPKALATRVSAQFSPRPVKPRIGLNAQPEGPRTWLLHIAFTAHVAAGPRSFYFITYGFPPRCPNASGSVVESPIARDVRAGQRVTTIAYIPLRCHGTLTGEVRYQGATNEPSPAPFTPANPSRTPLVGRFTATTPK